MEKAYKFNEWSRYRISSFMVMKKDPAQINKRKKEWDIKHTHTHTYMHACMRMHTHTYMGKEHTENEDTGRIQENMNGIGWMEYEREWKTKVWEGEVRTGRQIDRKKTN